MQMFHDVKRVDVVIVVFDFDEYRKIVLESTRTGGQINGIMQDVLAWGLEKYPYTTKQHATYGS